MSATSPQPASLQSDRDYVVAVRDAPFAPLSLDQVPQWRTLGSSLRAVVTCLREPYHSTDPHSLDRLAGLLAAVGTALAAVGLGDAMDDWHAPFRPGAGSFGRTLLQLGRAGTAAEVGAALREWLARVEEQPPGRLTSPGFREGAAAAVAAWAEGLLEATRPAGGAGPIHPLQTRDDVLRVLGALRRLLTALEGQPVRGSRLALSWDDFRGAFGDAGASARVSVDSTGRPDLHGLPVLIRQSTALGGEARDALLSVIDAVGRDVGRCRWLYRDVLGEPEPTAAELAEHERELRGRSDKPIRDARAAVRAAVDLLSGSAAPPAEPALQPGGAGQGEGGVTPANRSKGIPLDEAEIRVREWLRTNAREDPAAVTRDAVAAGTGVSAGQVSNTAAWRAFRDRRDGNKRSRVREVPLTDAMRATIAADGACPDGLAALIEQQNKETAEEDKRRHGRRHGPS